MTNIYISNTVAIETEKYFGKNEGLIDHLKLNHIFNSGRMKIDTMDVEDTFKSEVLKKYYTTFIDFNKIGDNSYFLEIYIPKSTDNFNLVNIGSIEVTVNNFGDRKSKNRKLSTSKSAKQINTMNRIVNLNKMARSFINMLYYIDIKIKDKKVIKKAIQNIDTTIIINENKKTLGSEDKSDVSNRYLDLENLIEYVNSNKDTHNKKINRITESWEVRGHYRRIKDKEGNVIKKVFVKAHVKGKKDGQRKEVNYYVQSNQTIAN